MNAFTQLVLIIGRITPQGVNMLGTGFFVNSNGLLATTNHVVQANDSNLVILAPHISQINDYQDLSETRCNTIPASVKEINPIRDLVLLQADCKFSGIIPPLASFDQISVGDEVGIFGFPHCVEGRRALTFQKAEIGAKILLESQKVKSKCSVINIQARPGQSGSLVFSPSSQKTVGILVGAFVPNQTGGISLGGINPRELHQTTHCISAEYLKEMM